MKTWVEIVEWLEDRGYHSDPIKHDEFATKQFFWRRVENPAHPCACNDKLQIGIELWEFYANNRILPMTQSHITASIEIRAEGPDGVWYELSAYSLNPDELIEKHDATIDRLIKAWNALHGD